MYNMDNITIICESEASEKIQMIIRQTDYTEEVAREKLMAHNDDPIKVIKDYMGIVEKHKPAPKSLNQEIYRQIRYGLSTEEYRKKNPINIDQVISNFQEAEEKNKK